MFSTAIKTAPTLRKCHYHLQRTKRHISHNKQNNLKNLTSLGRYEAKGHGVDMIRDVMSYGSKE
jgi:hypothetical protein